MKASIGSTYTSLKNGGFQEARSAMASFGALSSLPIFSPPGPVMSIGDGSTQVPNLRASEMFCALWAAHTYQDAQIVTDIMITGSVCQNMHHWGPWEPDEERLGEWLDFYSCRSVKPLLQLLAPISTVRFENGDIVSQRLKALAKFAGILDGMQGFNASSTLSRIKIVEHLRECEVFGITLGQVALNVPAGKAIGTWTCPCCGERTSLRFANGKYSVTDSHGGPMVKTCWGSQVVQSNASDSMSLATLIRVTGIELNFFASLRVHDIVEVTKPTFMIRDYSTPRGSIEESMRLYGDRIRLTTRNYFIGPDGDADMTFDELCMAATSNPAKFVELMNLHPIISEGGCLMVNWNG